MLICLLGRELQGRGKMGCCCSGKMGSSHWQGDSITENGKTVKNWKLRVKQFQKKKNGVFVGQFFCPKGFVLLGSQRVYWSIFFENCLEKWGAHYIRVHIIHK